ncbi:ferric reductase-like transmembrane domain-containing protein [Neobacillus sp. PS3-12]|uniref:ferric reductase-like transmembrane domain-containing protein n=1 Tax=Neobacillus sp. PS3-12 TaxID=3070677 RepID=UPI0027E163F7|nr:ferric reductase-like transmembrane domain-containing protein [Neobacillus sp. PS3-12]WML54389.1 ferric reductase-like transmembrane domain-containing protein [Neobacillus sp. PS3-12]
MQTLEWYMIRGTGTVAYILLYLTVIVGLFSQVQKKRKKKMTSAINLHEELSNWAMILVGGHLGLLLLDTYIGFKWTEVFVPFNTSYKPIPMALGTLSFYFLIITFITSKLRKKVGYLRWRKLHALNPILYILVTIHGLWIGTDFNPEILAIANLIPFPIIGIFALLMKFTKAKPQPKTTRAAVTRTRYTD